RSATPSSRHWGDDCVATCCRLSHIRRWAGSTTSNVEVANLMEWLSNISGNISLGLSTALSLSNLMFCFIGVLLGTVIGVIPGIGALAAISMLFPITFHLDPTSALIMLAGIWYGSS